MLVCQFETQAEQPKFRFDFRKRDHFALNFKPQGHSVGRDITKGESEQTKSKGAFAISLPGHSAYDGTFNLNVITGGGENQYALSKHEHATATV